MRQHSDSRGSDASATPTGGRCSPKSAMNPATGVAPARAVRRWLLLLPEASMDQLGHEGRLGVALDESADNARAELEAKLASLRAR